MAAGGYDFDYWDSQFQKLSVGSSEVSKCLPIWRKSTARVPYPIFTGHNVIGSFQINGDKSYSCTDVSHPKLVPETRFPGLIGLSLKTGIESFEASRFVDSKDNMTAAERKQEYFLKWLIEHNYFNGVADKKFKKPDFIGFGGGITESLVSPQQFDRFTAWEMYGLKFQDCIYLWNDRPGLSGQTDLKKRTQSYPAAYFRHVLTNENPADSFPNKSEQSFIIQETTFGTHQILTVNKVDAVDETGELVETATYEEKCPDFLMKAKYLQYWSRAIVPGIKHFVIGERKRNTAQLVKITRATVDEIAIRGRIQTSLCLDFEDRFLTWIKSCFKETGNDENVVKLFSRGCGDEVARVEDVPVYEIPRSMLPKWFIQRMK